MFVDKTVHRPTGSGRLRPGRKEGGGRRREREEELAQLLRAAVGAELVGDQAGQAVGATILVLEEEGRRKWS